SFPFDDYADLRAEGLLGLCVPERCGGLGADYETYCLVAEQLAQGNASTALTFNMHCLTIVARRSGWENSDNQDGNPGSRCWHDCHSATVAQGGLRICIVAARR